MEKKYTVEEIKKAFWDTFLYAGELWFPYPYPGSEPTEEDIEDGNDSVDIVWSDFIDSLTKE